MVFETFRAAAAFLSACGVETAAGLLELLPHHLLVRLVKGNIPRQHSLRADTRAQAARSGRLCHTARRTHLVQCNMDFGLKPIGAFARCWNHLAAGLGRWRTCLAEIPIDTKLDLGYVTRSSLINTIRSPMGGMNIGPKYYDDSV